MTRGPLHLFDGYGIEIEYMIVDRDTLAVMPIADELLRLASGKVESEVDMGPLCWSNELVLHVIELKTNGPQKSLSGLATIFEQQVGQVNQLLEPLSAMLMPSSMHPWMVPAQETKLWPHENSEIYQTYHRIFNCFGHGWANLQCVHINLPFFENEEFARLHAAIRLVLPLLPALAASSPVADGKISHFLDTRLEVYRNNQRKIPSLTGQVIPEPVFTKEQYQDKILDTLYRDVAPYDPNNILRGEWLNSRGAIARFDRNTIEIRVIDVQENPVADLAIVQLVVATLKALVSQRWSDIEGQKAWNVEQLANIFKGTIRDGETYIIEDPDYLRTFGFPDRKGCAQDVWRHLTDALLPAELLEPHVAQALKTILDQGPLARRLTRVLGKAPSIEKIKLVYRELCACLGEAKPFLEQSVP